jgi:predicted PolB exonuclease-like 3'-5' exonuclease
MQNITFIDIETVSGKRSLDQVSSGLNELFCKKFNHEIESRCKEQTDFDANNLEYILEAGKIYKEKAGLYAEFGKVVCVCLGRLQGDKFYLKTICGKDEMELLKTLSDSLSKSSMLAAHNGIEFDYPFLYRRYILNGLPVPPMLSIVGKKVWDVQDQLLDTMKIWSHMQWKHNISLELLSNLLGLPNPKEVLGGSKVGELYYSMFDLPNEDLPFDKEESVLKKIGSYCAADVITLANVYAKLRGYDLIKEEQVIYV